MELRDIAKIAYEAYCESRVIGGHEHIDRITPWDKLETSAMSAWIYLAGEVVGAIEDDVIDHHEKVRSMRRGKV